MIELALARHGGAREADSEVLAPLSSKGVPIQLVGSSLSPQLRTGAALTILVVGTALIWRVAGLWLPSRRP